MLYVFCCHIVQNVGAFRFTSLCFNKNAKLSWILCSNPLIIILSISEICAENAKRCIADIPASSSPHENPPAPQIYDKPASPSPAQPGPGLARPRLCHRFTHARLLSLSLSLSAAPHIHHHLARGAVATGNEKLERGAAARQVNTWILSLRTDTGEAGRREAAGHRHKWQRGNTNSTF